MALSLKRSLRSADVGRPPSAKKRSETCFNKEVERFRCFVARHLLIVGHEDVEVRIDDSGCCGSSDGCGSQEGAHCNIAEEGCEGVNMAFEVKKITSFKGERQKK